MSRIGIGTLRFMFNKMMRQLIGDFRYRELSTYVTCKLKLTRFYHDKPLKQVCPYVIYMADGKLPHGGIADRIKGMVSLYMFCNRNNATFKIYSKYPFNITDYLVPNQYDWRVQDEEISYNNKQSKPIIVKHSYLDADSYNYIDSCLIHNVNCKQLHVYTNAFTNSEQFSLSFHELFCPSFELANEINKSLNALGDKFVAVTFRFQQLLGDFHEGGFSVLNDKEKDILVEHCSSFIEDVKRRHTDISKILVTSDSISFLKFVEKKYNYVYIIPGVVYHVDYSNQSEKLAYMKSFVDLFVLSHASVLYNYSEGQMYRSSGFSYLASIIGGKEYIAIHNDI